ncbi:hypothetical protein DJ526_11610, partial [Sulfolobus sp. A20-N-G8]
GFAKLAVNEGMDLPLYSAFALEREMQNQALASEDAKEGAKAYDLFIELRKKLTPKADNFFYSVYEP